VLTAAFLTRVYGKPRSRTERARFNGAREAESGRGTPAPREGVRYGQTSSEQRASCRAISTSDDEGEV
jgi:hypothetical protein